MSATLRLRCDGTRPTGGACPATFTADVARDLMGLRCEAAAYGWAWRGVPGTRRDLCPTCCTPAVEAATDATVTAWQATVPSPTKPAPAPVTARCRTCGAPENAHPYRHPFQRPTLGRPTRQETRR